VRACHNSPVKNLQIDHIKQKVRRAQLVYGS
jgi:hypothetical protein